MIRKANMNDLDSVVKIYDDIISVEESGPVIVGWKRGVYPTDDVALGGIERGEMFVLEEGGEIVGSMILNKRQDAHYPLGEWKYDAPDDEVMVLHTFVVSPAAGRSGYGEKLFRFYEEYAAKCGCRYLRFSTNHTNYRSRNFYKKMGVEEVYEYHREGGKISVFFEKKLDVFLRKARREDVDAISEIYEEIHGLEEKGFLTTGWIRGVYPTKVTARNAVENDEMFVMEKCGEIVAAARINKVQDEVYREGRWQNAAGEDEVMVMHTLVVSPGHSSEGYGKLFAAFYENYAKENNCPYLRIDTNERNSRARKLYGSLGYSEAGVVSCEFNGIKGVNLVLLEKTAE